MKPSYYTCKFTMTAGMVKATVYIILQGKNFDFSWSPHFVGTLNSMAFLLSFTTVSL